MRLTTYKSLFICTILCFSLLISSSSAFESDELLVDDEEFGLEGGRSQSPPSPPQSQQQQQSQQQSARGFRRKSSESDSDSKIQFSLDHAFGDSDFIHAGNFSARVKTWPHGGQTLTKLRFSREDLSGVEKEKFKVLLQDDDFYKIRLPSNVMNAPGRDYIVSSVKARCLPRDGLDEHFVIHMEGVNILSVNYGSPGACPYPRQLKQPRKWSFNSHTVLKNSEQAPRTPTFSEDIPGASIEEEGVEPLAERSIWAKYWMYMIPLGLVVMNVVTQAMNLPEEQASGQAPPQGQQQPIAGNSRGGQGPAVRRR